MDVASPSSSSMPVPPGSSLPPRSKRSVDLKKRLFYQAIDNGCTKREASRLAGCSESAGSKWAKVRHNVTLDSLPSKDQLVVSLFKAYSEAKPSSKANLAKRICDMLGYDMRASDSDNTRQATEPLRDLVARWASERVQRSRSRGGSPQTDSIGGDQTHSETATNFPESGADSAPTSEVKE